MKVCICGSRSIEVNDYNYMELCHIIKLAGFDITEVVCGDARGADKLGELWANNYHIPITHFPANWDKYGRSAGYIRNKQMVDYSDAVISFWDGKSRGTQHTISLTREAGKPLFIYP